MWLPILVFTAALVLVISISWTNFVGAPWVPTSMRLVNKMLKLADVDQTDIVYDLGCGDGRTIVTAARRYGARAVGIEIDPFRYVWCQFLITILGLRDRVEVIYGNFFDKDLSEATVITCYLLQDTNKKLQVKLNRELTQNARVVSHTFTFPGMIPVRQDGDVRLYLFYPEEDNGGKQGVDNYGRIKKMIEDQRKSLE